MLPTTGLPLLIRREPISDGEWLDLIEKRRSLIKPHLDVFRLAEFGRVEALANNGHLIPISFSALPCTGNRAFSLQTQGIFFVGKREKFVRDINKRWPTKKPYPWQQIPERFVWVGGLTRANEWIVAKVGYRSERYHSYSGHERYRDVAKCVKFWAVTLQELLQLLGITPKHLLCLLDRRIYEWEKFRYGLYLRAKEIADEARFENRLISELDRKLARN